MKYPDNDEESQKINNFFIKYMNYYNQTDNLNNNSKITTFNILVCGVVGVGKSTFINQFIQEKFSQEGEGLSVTYNIKNYIHPKYPIKIIDTPGFESDNSVQIIRKFIEKSDKDMFDSNNHIDLILYFIRSELRPFFSSEIELIQWLIKENKRVNLY